MSKIISPNILKSEIFTVVQPVTQTAEVEINKESIKDKFPLLKIQGIFKRKAPNAINSKKETIKFCQGFK